MAMTSSLVRVPALSTLHLLLCVATYSYAYNTNSFVDKTDPNTLQEACGPCFVGPAGPAGVPGVPGMPGSHGRDGRKGETGEMGNSGIKGQVGPEGPPGKRGSRGRKGHPGDRGDRGEKGSKGDRGDRGPPGLPGVQGYAMREPRKVAFSVARSLKLGPLIKDSTVLFDSVITNVGDCFDEHTSHFVCRVNGTYLFATHVLSQNNKDVYAWIMLNNKHKLPLHGDGRAGYGTGSQTVILRLVKGDRVWLQLRKDSALLNDFSTFSGYMLFED